MKTAIAILTIILTALGFSKWADSIDTTISNKAIKSERSVASNGGICGAPKKDTDTAPPPKKS